MLFWLWTACWLSALCQKGLISRTNGKIEVRRNNIQYWSIVKYKIATYPAFFKKLHCKIFQLSTGKAQRIVQIKSPWGSEKGTRIWENGCFEHSVENGRSMTLLSQPHEGQMRALHSLGKCSCFSHRRKDWKVWGILPCLSWKTQHYHLLLALKSPGKWATV